MPQLIRPRFISTEGQTPPRTLTIALQNAFASDGGIFVPETFAVVGLPDVGGGPKTDFRAIIDRLTPFLFGEVEAEGTLVSEIAAALDFPIPLVPVAERLYVLELFHGPTLAFKDVGARVMARLLDRVMDARPAPRTIVTATSGDTGGAVAAAFHRRPGVRVLVLFPEGRVSDLQEKQFTTLGDNITAVGVRGTFDDCQQLAKMALADERLVERFNLTSANSINIGRLLPQVLYYFHALAQLPTSGAPVIVSVPSGNLGNLTAGLFAKRMGLPVQRFIAATNINDVFARYLDSGRIEPAPARETISTAMDVGNPSNLDRIRWLYRDEVDAVRADVSVAVLTDDETRTTMRRVSETHGYVLDPHSAVGYQALESALHDRPDAVGVLLATAHPAKFAGVVGAATGQTVALPARLEALVHRSGAVISIDPALQDVVRVLQSADSGSRETA